MLVWQWGGLAREGVRCWGVDTLAGEQFGVGALVHWHVGTSGCVGALVRVGTLAC